MLDVLARAGVVDAGGSGYLLLLDALLTVVDGRALPEPGDAHAGDVAEDRSARVGDVSERPAGGVADLRYEVMYLLEASDAAVEAFREVWAGLGDSIVVVGGDGLWQCHIHTDDIGAAIEAALDAGRPSSIRVTDLLEQVEEERWVRDSERVADSRFDLGPSPVTDVVAVVTGDGIGRILRSLGVHHQVVGGQSMNPSTAEILRAVDAQGSGAVVILPNKKNIVPVAQQVDALSAKTVRVVPTGSIVEGFAALLAYDPASSLESNVEAMAASAAGWCRARSRWPFVTRRPRSARCTPGSGSAYRAGCRLDRFDDGRRLVLTARPPAHLGPRAGHAHRGGRLDSVRYAADQRVAPQRAPRGGHRGAPRGPTSVPLPLRHRVTGEAANESGRRLRQLSELPVTLLAGVGAKRGTALVDWGGVGPRPAHDLSPSLHRPKPPG